GGGRGSSSCGVRLGRGAGYYDRFLARLGPSVLRIGVTVGLVDGRLPADDHDVAMTHLATPDGVVAVPPGGVGLSSG
ncbi:MAG: 5-formyltetrahydrofolate cyclo-ligase, partial [Actinomycetota bacterium]